VSSSLQLLDASLEGINFSNGIKHAQSNNIVVQNVRCQTCPKQHGEFSGRQVHDIIAGNGGEQRAYITPVRLVFTGLKDLLY